MKWRVVKKGNRYVKRPQFDVEEWVILMLIALALDIVFIGLIIEGV